MAKKTLLLALLLLAGFCCWAQKYACVNTEYVMANVPDYVQAQTRLNKYVTDWQKEIEAKTAELDNLRASYQQEAYLLPENLKQHRQTELKTKEQELKELQRQRFAPGGDLDKKRAELLKPVQDRIYSAIERIAREKNYAIILDKSGSPTVVYAAAKYDISDQVLEMLGYKPEAAPATSAPADNGKKAPENNELSKPKR